VKALVELLLPEYKRIRRLERVFLYIGQELQISTLPQKYSEDLLRSSDKQANATKRRSVNKISQTVLPATTLLNFNRKKAARVVIEVKDMVEVSSLA
jgi:hypothetical protein